jgi:UDP-glucose:(heptosyl)LPS alpha-1,3-glucosyltransferase
MKIALVIEHLDPRRGGAEVYVRDFAAWLLGRGHEVAILTADAHDPPPGAGLVLLRPAGLTRGARGDDFARRAAATLREIKPDTSLATGKALGMRVYQPHGGTVRGSQRQNLALVGCPVARALKAGFNLVSPKHRAARRLEERQFGDPRTRFVAISEMVRRDMQNFYHIAEHRIALIYNGVDLDRFHPERLRPRREAARKQFPVESGTTLFLFVAHNFKLKGLDELFGAAARLAAGPAGRFHLAVVGRGRVGAYRRLARRKGLGHLVTFVPDCGDIASMYAAADAFVHPTWYDPCSLVVLEALASGLPTITTRFNGASEMMADSGAGIVLESPRPVERLAEVMGRLLNVETRRGMSLAARRVAENYPQERNFQAMLDCLTRAAEEGRT